MSEKILDTLEIGKEISKTTIKTKIPEKNKMSTSALPYVLE